MKAANLILLIAFVILAATSCVVSAKKYADCSEVITLNKSINADFYINSGLESYDYGRIVNRSNCAIVRPYDEISTKLLMKWLNKNQIPTVIRGSGHGTHGWSVGGPDQIVVDVSGLDAVLRVDPYHSVPQWVEVSAGLYFSEVINVTLPLGLTPCSLDFKDAEVAGVLSGAGGLSPSSAAYGFVMNNVLSMRVLTWEGKIEVVEPSDDLFHLVLGNNGIFGVILSATLKLYPAPAYSKTAVLIYFDANPFLADADALQAAGLCNTLIGSSVAYTPAGQAGSGVVWNASAVPVGYARGRFLQLKCSHYYPDPASPPSDSDFLSLVSQYAMSGFSVQATAVEVFATTNAIRGRIASGADNVAHPWWVGVFPRETAAAFINEQFQDLNYIGGAVMFFVNADVAYDTQFFPVPQTNGSLLVAPAMLAQAPGGLVQQQAIQAIQANLCAIMGNYSGVPYLNTCSHTTAEWKAVYDVIGVWDNLLCALKKYNADLLLSPNTGLFDDLNLGDVSKHCFI